jgi:hypothetical protein
LLGEFVELKVVQVSIELVLGEQLPMAARGLHPALVEQKDAIAGANGRYAVGKEDRGPAG